MTSLYLCYQSISEPLTQTQVVAYLEGLARAGYRMVLLTFEPRPLTRAEAREWRERLLARGVTWHWLRYHKRPTAPATAWDIAAGIAAGLRLVRRYDVQLLHARSHVPGVMALALKRLTGAKFLFDPRGFLAEEYVDAGHWPADGRLFRMTKRAERALVQAADGIVVLTHKAEELLRRWYPGAVADTPLYVIPCCVDLRQLPGPAVAAGRLPAAGGQVDLVYAGKLGGAYRADAMAAFVAIARERIPDLRWQVWTQSDPAPLRRIVAATELEGAVTIGRLPADEIPAALAKADVGLSFPEPAPSKLAMSPTKVGEYLAAGLPVVSSAGIGDVDALLTGSGAGGGAPVGVLLREFTQDAYRAALPELLALLADPGTPHRCRAVAEEQLDLERVGWARYRQVYQQLIGA